MGSTTTDSETYFASDTFTDRLRRPVSALAEDWAMFGPLGRVVLVALMPVALVVGFCLGSLACLVVASYLGV